MTEMGLDVQTILEMIKVGQISPEDGLRLYAERRRAVASAEGSPGEQPVVYCQSAWEPSHAAQGAPPAGPALVFDTGYELRSGLQAHLGGGAPVILVTPGEACQQRDDRAWQIHPGREEDYAQLLRALDGQGLRPATIVHAWSRGGPAGSPEDVETRLAEGAYSLLHLGKALLARRPAQEVALVYLYDAGAPGLPLYAGAGGLLRTLRLESPSILGKAVGVLAADPSAWLDTARRELSAPAADAEVLYEDGRRLVRRLRELAPGFAPGDGAPVRARGVYVILGGLGGLGGLVAERLAQWSPGAALVLAGRSPLTPDKERRLGALAAVGARAIYLQADIARRASMEALVAEVRARFGAIHGAFHCAGVLRDALLARKTRASMAEVLAPKVHGTVHLDEVLKAEPLDFFVLFSSMVTATGNVGQGDYAFACAFQDHFAAYREALRRRGARAGRTVAIGWPLWRDGGMMPDERSIAWARDAMGLAPLEREAGLEALAAALRGPHAQLAVLAGDPPKIRAALGLRAPGAGAEAPAAPTAPVTPAAPAGAGGGDPAVARARAEAWVKEVLAEEIKLLPEKIDASKHFEAYGIDSIMVVTLTRALEARFGPLSKTLLFEHQSVAELADHLAEHHARQLTCAVEPAAPPGPPPRAEEPSAARRPRFLPVPAAPAGTRGDAAPRQVGPAAHVLPEHEDIAIVGVAGRYPMAEDLDQFWGNLKSGRDCVVEIPPERWDHRLIFSPDKERRDKSYSKWGGFITDVDQFDPLFFHISPRDAELMDPQERIFLEAAWHALEDGGYTRARLARERVGVFVGAMYSHYQLIGLEESLRGAMTAPGSFFASIANRVSYHFNLRGPSIALDTLCSSSLTAVHLACESIRRGEIDAALAGGVNLTIHPSKYFILSHGGFAASDGRCRSFGEGGDGYVPGEGVGALLLRPLRRAVTDGDLIYGVIKATALNHGGKTNGMTVPNPNAQRDLIIEALRRAKVDPRWVSYVEAHGTGTALGDPIEITGLTKAFHAAGDPRRAGDRQFCAIGSVKSNIGHLESAAGLAGITKVLLQMKHRALAPSLHAERLNPNTDFESSPFYVQRTLAEWQRPVLRDGREEVVCPRIAGVSSFGAGGANAHVVLQEYEPPAAPAAARPQGRELIVLSSRDRERLAAYAAALRDHLARLPEPPGGGHLADLAYTLQVGREPMAERLALVASSVAELVEQLSAYCEGRPAEGMHQGNGVEQPRPALSEREAGGSSLSAALATRNLARLAELWIAGAEIDWERLAPAPKPRRISLPPRPFVRQRCWIGAAGAPLLAEGAPAARLHPLIERNTSVLEEQRFTTRLRGDEPYLVDHVVGGRRVLPGVVVLEMARAAGELAGLPPVRRIRQAVWAAPLAVDPDVAAEVSISLSDDDNGVEYEVWTSREGSARRVHARGRLLPGEPTATPARLDVEAVLARCPTRWTAAACYARFRERGLVYGPSFRALQDLAFGPDEALARIALPAGLAPELGRFVLHATLLDGALQALLGPLEARGVAGATYVPFALGAFDLLGPLEQAAYAHARRVADASQEDPAVERFEIRVFSEDGRPLAALADLAVRRSDRVASAQAKGAGWHLFRPAWRERPLRPAAVQAGGADRRGALLIFDLGRELMEAARRRLAAERAAPAVLLISPGSGFAEHGDGVFTVRPGASDDYQQLLAALERDGLRAADVLHLWSREPRADDVVAQLQRGFSSVLHLAQAVAAHRPSGPVRLAFVHAEEGGGARPAYAAIGALARSLRLEDPRLTFKAIAIPAFQRSGACLAPGQLEQLLLELRAPDGSAEVRHDGGGRRWERSWEEHAPEGDAPIAPAALRRRGVYLITGGAGVLGLAFAERLARSVEARVVLSGRSALSEGPATRIRALTERGAEVVYIQADVSRRDEAAGLIAAIKSRFGAIDGVLHAAGVTRDALLANKTSEAAQAVLAPKVYGTLWLDEATRGEDLGAFVLFSSAAAALGNVGQCDYAFANSFLDHFAAERERLRAEGHRSGRTLSINWPLWEEGGMKVPEAVQAWMKEALGWAPLSTGDGLAAFEASLRSAHPQLLVLSGSRDEITAALTALTDAPPAERAAPGTGDARAHDPALRERVEEHLKALLSVEIKLPPHKISGRAPIETFGIDSLVAMNLTRKLERDFGELPKTLFFEHRSMAEIAGYLLDRYLPRAIDKFGQAARPVAAQETPGAPATAAAAPRRRRTAAAEPAAPNGGEAASQEAIAIVGLSGRYPMARNLEEFWERLRSGADCITEIPRDRWDHRSFHHPDRVKAGRSVSRWGGFLDDVDKFDPLFFAISPREAKIMDPQERQFLEIAWHAVEDAGYTREGLRGSVVGVFVGVMYAHYQLLSLDPEHRDTGFTPSSLHASIANRVSYLLDLRGPSLAVDTMCSSSLTAVHLACESIRRGECDLAVAGGVNLSLHPNKYLALSQGKFTSSDGRCRSFGEGGDGYVPGEGVGALVLKRLRRAEADGDHIYAIVRGSAINHGGRTNGYTVPNPAAQAEVIARALRQAGLDPRTIGYIEAHGTGTSLGDPIEIAGLKGAFEALGAEAPGRRRCPIGSVKSNIGHLESAAGIAGISKVLLQMKHGLLAPSIHADQLNPHLALDSAGLYVQRALEPWARPVIREGGEERVGPRQAGVSSFGAGGSNAHLILEEHLGPARPAGELPAGPHVVVLSARTREQLDVYARNLAASLGKQGGAAPPPPLTSCGAAGGAGAVERELLGMAARALGVTLVELDPEEPLGEYGFEPVSLALLAQQVAQAYGTDPAPALLAEYTTIRALAHELADREGAQPAGKPAGAVQAPSTPTPALDLADIAYTLQVGREAMEERMAVSASTVGELRDKLERHCSGATGIEGVYLGNARRDAARSELLLEGDEGAELVRILARERKLDKLAKLWVLGAEVDWEIVRRSAGGAARRRVPLPTYPFARERHWLPEAPPSAPAADARLHALLDRVEPRRSLEQGRGVVFRKAFTPADPILRDHKVGGRAILPGVGYLEIARAAAAEVSAGAPLGLGDVVWLQPVAVDDQPKIVDVVLREEGSTLRFEVQSEHASGKWVTHAKGEIRRGAAEGDTSEHVNLDVLRARCAAPVTQGELYAQFKAVGMDYGPSYQLVEQAWVGGDEVLGLLTLPAERERELADHVIHPMMMDAALHVIGALAIRSGEDARALLPFAAERVDLIRPLTSRLYAHARRTSKGRYRVEALDEQGRLCIRVVDLLLRPLKDSDALPDFFFTPLWRPAPLPADAEAPRAAQGTVLVIEPPEPCDLEDLLAEAHRGARVIRIALGAATVQRTAERWELATGDAAMLDAMLTRIEDLRAIYYLAGIEAGPAAASGPAALESSQERGVLSLFRLVKALLRCGFAQRPLQLKVVTHEVHPVLPGEASRPYAASLIGFSRSLAKECSQWAVSCVDIRLPPGGEGAADALRALGRSIAAEPASRRVDEVALRDGRRYMRVLVPLELPPAEQLPLRRGGVYLILGGAGGIGLELARHLAAKVGARLALVGRRELDDQQRAKIARVEALGGSVLYVRADAADPIALGEAIRQTKARFGRIDGVVHSAVLLRDRIIENMDEATFRAVLAPKVGGSVALADALAGEPLDFLLFFSSAQSFAGSPGQSNYAAACTFKDAFALHLAHTAPYTVRIINWGYWGEVGVAAGEVHAKRLAAQGVGAILIEEGLKALERVLAHSVIQVLPMKAEERVLASMGVDRRERAAFYPAPRAPDAAAEATRAQAPPARPARPALIGASTLLQRLEAELTAQVASALTMVPEAIDRDRQFSEYGVDSVIGIELITAINTAFGITLRTTALFDHSSVTALARLIAGEHGARATAALAARAAAPAAPDASAEPAAPAEYAEPIGAWNAPAELAPVERVPGVAPGEPAAPSLDPVAREAAWTPADADAPREPAQEGAAVAGHRAVVITRPGHIDDLRIEAIHPREPGDREVQIHVKAFALNFGDLLCVKGLYPTMPEYPFTPGFEVSGVVLKAGANVDRVRVGDEVIGLVGASMGGNSTLLNLEEGAVARKPANVSHEEACAFPLVFMTMDRAFELAQVQPGERVLIHTAAGGTGLISVQLAQQLGAEVHATAGSREKLEHLARLGVPHLINYREEDFASRVLEITGGRGVDVVFNTLSGDAIQKNIDILAPGGRYVEIAMTGLKSARSVSLARLIDNQTFYSVDLRKLLRQRPDLGTRCLDRMVEVLASGRIRPTVGKVVPFAAVREAYRYLEERKNIGKVVITTADVAVEPPSPLPRAGEAESRLAATPHSREIAIVGMAGRFPGARDLDELWGNLVEGRSAIGEVPSDRWDIGAYYDPDPQRLDRTHCRWGGFLSDIDQFDPLFFNISGKEAQLTDPQQRLFLEVSWAALEDAGYATGALSNRRCGVFVGVGQSDYVDKMTQAGAALEAQSFWGNEPSVVPARLSYFMDMKGPSVAVNTACSSSLVAMHLACQSLLAGESELAVAGGVFVRTTPRFHVLNSNAGMLSPDGRCKTFDNGANGYVPGEGVGAVVLKRLEDALRDGDNIHAVIKGSGVNQDGRTNGITAPSVRSQTDLELLVYESSGIDPETITLVEAHGTGTKLGDPIEVEALTNAFRRYTEKKQYCALGSVKTNIGHSVAAAGVASIIKVALALKHAQIPPSLHFTRPNEYIDFEGSPFYVPTTARAWDVGGAPRRAAVSSFGFSGTNAHLVMEEAPLPRPPPAPRPAYLFPLSAKTEAALRERVADLLRWLDAGGAQHALGDTAFTLHLGRSHFPVRLALVAGSREELARGLRELDLGEAAGASRWRNLRESPAAPDPGRRDTGEALIAALGSGALTGDRCREALVTLRDLYIEGYDLDWARLYAGARYRRVSLPSYPFARGRYWFHEPGSQADAPVRSTHPLVGKPDEGAGPQELAFRKVLRRDMPIVADHDVQGQPILPGVAQIEAAFAAAAHALGDVAHDITDLVWLQPLVVPEEGVALRVALKKGAAGLTVEIQSEAAGRRVTHARGALRPRGAAGSEPGATLPIEAIQVRCAARPDPERGPYARLRAMGIRHGRFFRTLAELWVGEQEVLARLALTPEHPVGSGGYHLHPSLLDGALQALAAVPALQASRRPHLPFAVDRVELLHPLERGGYAHVTPGRDPLHFNIAVADEAGRVCIRLQELALRELVDPLARFFYLPVWRPAPRALPSEPPSPAVGARATVLLVHPPRCGGLAEAISAVHSLQGDEVVSVELGASAERLGERSYRVPASEPRAIDEILCSLPALRGVYFLGGVQPEPPDPGDLGVLSRGEELGVMSLLRLVAALGRAGHAARPLTLKVVTSDAAEVGPSAICNPHAAGLFGLCRVLAKERTAWQVSCVDVHLEHRAALHATAEAVVAEPGRPGGEEVAIRQGRRYERALVPFDLPPAAQPPFREGGVYLIVGGAGGIGMELAVCLAERVRAKVVLVGRSAESEVVRAKLDRIEARGGQALYVTADAADPAALRAAVEAAKRRFGALHGVVHSAIVLRDRLLDAMDEATFRAALAPKAAGSVALYQALRGEPLDFVLFFSSSQSFIGNAGQSNYAAACTFKDAFARWWAARAQYPVKILSWGYWGEVGVVATEEHQRRLAARGLYSIQPAEGMEAVARILAGRVEQVMPIKASDELLAAMGADLEQRAEARPEAGAPRPGWAVDSAACPVLDGPRVARALDELAAIERFGAVLLLAGFQRMGALRRAGERGDADELRRRLGIAPAFARLHDALLDILARAGFIVRRGAEIEAAPTLDDPALRGELAAIEQGRERLVARWPELAAHARLLWACAERYPEILRGEVLATDVLFPRSSNDLVEAIYAGSVLVDHYNRTVLWAARAYIEARLPALSPGEKIHILEVGAGTGGTSGPVLEGLRSCADRVRYVYTDVSAGFTQHGRRRFGATHRFAEFQVLNIEQDVAAQGFTPGEYDLVIAANVLHATRRIERTLRNVKDLLKAGGCLVLNEVTAAHNFTTLTFGLLEGWWLFEDGDRRLRGAPLLDAPRWEGSLREAGFPQLTTLGLEAPDGRQVGQHVFLAGSDGVIIRPRAAAVPAPSPFIVAGHPRGAQAPADRPAAEPTAPPFLPEALSVTQAARAPVDDDARRREVETTIAARVAAVLQLDPRSLDRNTPYTDFGVDSLLAADIVARLNEIPGFHLRTQDLFNYANIRTLAEHVLAGSAVRPSITSIETPAPGAEASWSSWSAAESPAPAAEASWSSWSAAEAPAPAAEASWSSWSAAEAPALVPEASWLDAEAPAPAPKGHLAAAEAPAPTADASGWDTEAPAPATAPAARRTDIAIVGMSGRFPDADDFDAFWRNLASGRDSVREITRWDPGGFYDPDPGAPGKSYSKWGGLLDDIERFDPLFFNVSGREAELMDPQQRLFLEESWKAIEDACYADRDIEGTRCSVFVGVGTGDYGAMLKQLGVPLEAYSFTGNSSSILAARISYFLNLKGASVPIDTACSSSLVAVHLASEALRSGACDMAIAGGVAVMSTPEFYVCASRSGMLSPDGRCKTFDGRANGFVPGEGVGVLVLKRLEDALRDGDHIHGVIAGSGINQDGKTNGITSPSAPSQTALEREVYDRFGIDPAAIAYVEAHGTGTRLGDPIEIEALATAFRHYTDAKQYCAVGSAKTNMGHALTAAGVVGLIKVLLCLRHRKLVPSLHLERSNELIDFGASPFFVCTALQDWPAPRSGGRLATVSSFGFSGTNAHIVVREAPAPPRERLADSRPFYLIPLSAKTGEALRRRVEDLAAWLDGSAPPLLLRDLAFSLHRGRSHFPVRMAFLVSSSAELARELRRALEAPRTAIQEERAPARAGGGDPARRREGQALLEALRLGRLSPADYRAHLEELSRLYLDGCDLDWAPLHDGEDHRRLSLPSYRFARERYRPPAPEARRALAPGGPDRPHPLLGRNTSTLHALRFATRLTADDPVLADHVALGRPALPGAACLEMALGAAALAGEGEVMALRNIAWLRPIRLDEASAQVEVLIGLRSAEDGSVDFEISTGEAGPPHAQGRVVFRGAALARPEAATLDLKAIERRCARSLDPGACYRALTSLGLEYGRSFRVISALSCGEGEALARLELPPALGGEITRYTLHPSLLDGAMQAVAALGISTAEGTGYLPVALGELVLGASLPARCYAHVRTSRGGNGAAAPLRRFDILIADEAGRMCVDMKGFAVKAIPHAGGATPRALGRAGGKDGSAVTELSDQARLEILRRLERGALSADEAERLLGDARSSGDVLAR